MEIFDKEAKEYDSWYQTTMGNYVFTKESALLTEVIGNTSGKKILEVGCATGIHSRFLLREDNQITGVDISSEMITEAKRYETKNLHFEIMDAFHLEFEDNSFDIVFSATMIEFVEKRTELFKELNRVTKENGIIVIGTIQKGSYFYDLYKTPYFQENTVFQYAQFLDLKELKSLAKDQFIEYKECLFHTPKEIEENVILEDVKNNKPGSFLVCVYKKGESNND